MWKVFLGCLVALSSAAPSRPVQDAPAAPAAPAGIERPGVLVPSSCAAVRLDLEVYRGELRFKEVAEHGAFVQSGDVVARFDLEAIDNQIHDAEMEMATTQMRNDHAVRQAEMDADASKQKLDMARLELERARRAYDGWLKFEKEFTRRDQERSQKYQENNIADQKEELTQLEAMYREDELTDATEEIVLNRTRRDFSMAQENLKLSDERRAYQKQFVEPVDHERKKEQLAEQERGLDRLIKGQEMEREQRQDSLKRSADGLRKVRENLEKLQRDREKLAVRANRSGVLLHGSVDDYGPGRAPPRHKMRGSAGAGADLFTVADPDRFKVVLDVPESMLPKVTQGMAVTITPVAGGKAMVGPLKFERFPAPRSMAGPENTYDAWVALDQPVLGMVAGMRAKVSWSDPGAAAASTAPAPGSAGK